MEFIDISVGVSPQLPIWPGDPPIELTPLAAIAAGDQANVTKLSAAVHIGTHVDAPRHFIEGGASVEELPLDVLIGEVIVAELLEAPVIDAEHLRSLQLPPGTERLLFKTGNSDLWAARGESFTEEYVAIDESGARWLVEQEVALVGIDYLSIAPWGQAAATHRRLLEAGVVIVEGLNLSGVSPGRYQLYCLPLKLVGCDGAPARALLGRSS